MNHALLQVVTGDEAGRNQGIDPGQRDGHRCPQDDAGLRDLGHAQYARGDRVSLGVGDLAKFTTDSLCSFSLYGEKKKSDIYSSVLGLKTLFIILGCYLILYAICNSILCLFLTTCLTGILASVITIFIMFLAFKLIVLPNFWIKSIYKFSGLKKILKKYFDKQALNKSKIDLYVGTVDLKSSVLTYHAKDEITTKEILASCTIPAFFPPVTKGNMQYVDGGVRDIAPMRPAIKNGATDILELDIKKVVK